VEKEEEVLDLINKSINLVGIENIVIHPDCGMRMLPKEVAKEKLITMCKAVQRIKETKK
jgi:5-methyltetrahydropteroyltriglutamate--homocysteine methyltransferase